MITGMLALLTMWGFLAAIAMALCFIPDREDEALMVTVLVAVVLGAAIISWVASGLPGWAA